MKLTKPEITICLVIGDCDDILLVNCLNSIKNIGSILIGDIGIKKEYSFDKNTTIKKLSLKNDFSEIKNELIKSCKTEWILFLEPWEVLDKFELPKEKGIFRTFIINDTVITKDVRLWNNSQKIKIRNPIFETSGKLQEAKPSEIWIKSFGDNNYKKNILEKWINEKPLDANAHYYNAFYNLSQGKEDTFLNEIEYYLFSEQNKKMSYYNAIYYQAKVLISKKITPEKVINNLLQCISNNPLLAEYWCLLGDLFFMYGDYKKSKIFYENAIIMGKQRDFKDEWPIEVEKYKIYPEKMISFYNNNEQKIYY